MLIKDYLVFLPKWYRWIAFCAEPVAFAGLLLFFVKGLQMYAFFAFLVSCLLWFLAEIYLDYALMGGIYIGQSGLEIVRSSARGRTFMKHLYRTDMARRFILMTLMVLFFTCVEVQETEIAFTDLLVLTGMIGGISLFFLQAVSLVMRFVANRMVRVGVMMVGYWLQSAIYLIMSLLMKLMEGTRIALVLSLGWIALAIVMGCVLFLLGEKRFARSYTDQ
ncbi:MAG: hypothetical protein K6E81_10245 [Lachnospiraceae bacterium]|nr:hypothetical protein [Lachnospiraceae bacterium]